MPTHLDFKCRTCGKTATHLGTVDGALLCAAHKGEVGARVVGLTGFDRDLWSHTLEVVHEAAAAQVYRLVDPAWGGAEAQSTRIAVLGGYVAVYGDLCPGRERHDNTGVIAAVGGTRSWFVGATSPDYLCGKFLDKVFVPELAAAKCRDTAENGCHDEVIRDEIKVLAEEADDLDVRDVEAIEAWKRRLYNFTEDAEGLDGCYGYEPTNAALLCAIQRRFRFLWLAREAVRIAREETERAHAAGKAAGGRPE